MALRAGYYGVKKRVLDELEQLDGILPADASKDNKLVTRGEIDAIVEANELTGVVNVLKNNLTTGSSDGITYTHNDDDTISLDTGEGSASASTSIYLNNNVPLVKGKTYILDGGENTSNNIVFEVRGYYGNTDKKSIVDVRDGGHKAFTPDYDGYDNIRVRLWVRNATAISNKKIYPTISPAGYYNGDYVQYALTNTELTLSESDQKTTINAIITAATGAADFAAFKAAMEAITPVTRSAKTIEPEAITEELVVEKKTTRKKSTAKADTTEEV